MLGWSFIKFTRVSFKNLTLSGSPIRSASLTKIACHLHRCYCKCAVKPFTKPFSLLAYKKMHAVLIRGHFATCTSYNGLFLRSTEHIEARNFVTV